jgi:glycosyltransferase involved in cell wall biosynthesis
MVAPLSAQLVVDARKAFDAGIGTYIRHVVPRVLDRLPLPARVLVAPGASIDWLGTRIEQAEPLHARALGWTEQVALRQALSRRGLFWATSLAHPIGSRRPFVATVYDVAQLALPAGELGGHWPTRLAASTLLHSQRSRALALLAISKFTRDEFVSKVGEPSRCTIDVVPLGVDESWFTVRAATAAQPYFLCVGSVRPHKNIERLLQAYALASEAIPHRLRVVGRPQVSGRDAAWLKRLPGSLRGR